ncbi:MAG: YhgE/Pip domain-containing protein [Firmicutes bacterium]|nr:YhgE/Pip domain-containing protein [Bacillota bacterium]
MIWNHIKEDFQRIRESILVLVIIVGVSLVPCMYAWFNIGASWDPYKQTEGIRIAVANEDEGYRSTLAPAEINIGDKVKQNLAVTDLLDWNFTDKKEAVDGVKSGKYYAAIVIPQDFSEKMLSFLSPDAEAPVLQYYSNQKKNAVASTVTDKGADAITGMLKETFTKTVYETSFDSVLALSDSLDRSGGGELLTGVKDTLEQSSSSLDMQMATLRGFQHMTNSGRAALRAGDDLMSISSDAVEEGVRGLKEDRQDLAQVGASLKQLNRTMRESLDKNLMYMDMLSSDVDDLFLRSDQHLDHSIANVQGIIATLKQDVDDKSAVQQRIGDLNRCLPIPLRGLEIAEDKIARSIDYEQSMIEVLGKVNDKKSTTQRDANALRSEFLRLKDKNVANLRSLRDQMSSEIFSQFNRIRGDLDMTRETVQGAWDDAGDVNRELSRMSKDLQGDLEGLSQNMDDSIQLLQNAKDKVDGLYKQTERLENSDEKNKVDHLLGEDASDIGRFFSGPVQTDTHRLYPVENYGSAMASFYTTLSLWVGGVIQIALLEVETPDSYREKYGEMKPYQSYFGRLALFLVVSLIQSTLIAMGDLYFLGIQCLHPFHFILLAWIAGMVFAVIMYTLTISFRNVGKAICVILMVLQVAGSGGTFPIDVTPSFFRKVHPFLPFVHSIRAMQETIAGFYGNVYWREILILQVYVLLSLLLGLVLRKPVIRVNEMLEEKLEETKVM